jgi:simple sugar transport system permease protein
MKKLTSHRLLWPAVVLIALLLANLLWNHSFFDITLRDGNLYGAPVDILRRAAPIVLVALGMTLVIATRGIDLSVGAVAAISGSWASMYIISSADGASVSVVLTAVGVALLMALIAGAWNGFLVSVLGIQPIVATLVLMVAGRGLAQVITDEKILYPDNSPAYKLIGGGYLLAVPFSILLAGGIFALTAVLTRKTALGTLIESVGVNPEASRLAGVRARPIIFLAYVFSGLCAGIAGLMLTSNSTSADPNSIGLFIELDAILAVVIGGTSLARGRFSLAGTLIGAFIIETMDAFVVIAISARSTDVFKACVVIIVCLLQSSRVRAWLLNVLRWGRTPTRTHHEPPPPTASKDLQIPSPIATDPATDTTNGSETTNGSDTKTVKATS